MESIVVKVNLPTLGVVSINFRDISAEVVDLFNNIREFSRQKGIKHLGLIAEVFEGSSHSRYEYVMLQCAFVDLVENQYKGSPNIALGGLTINGQEISGNAIIKSWFLLSNFGHTKYTYGDEKSLILFAIKNKGFRTQLLKPIKDKSLKKWCQKVILNYDYSHMNFVLAIIRIYKETFRNVKLRVSLLQVLKLLLLKSDEFDIKVSMEKLEQLKKIYNVIRELSIITIDGHYSHIPININSIAAIISMGEIEKNYNNNSLTKQLKPIISLLHDEIYLNKNVLELQRNYEIESQEVLQTYKSVGLSKLLTLAFSDGLLTDKNTNLKHFARLEIGDDLQNGDDFKLQLKKLEKVRTGCRDTDYYIDSNPISGLKYIDIFLNEGRFNKKQLPALVFNICNFIYELTDDLEDNANYDVDIVLDYAMNLSNKYNVDIEELSHLLLAARKLTYPELNRRYRENIIPLFKELLWSVMRYFIDEKYFLDIDIHTKKYPPFNFKLNEMSNELFLEKFDSAINNENNFDRAAEIKQLKRSAGRQFEGYKLASLTRITIYDLSKPPGSRIVTDIDSVLIKVNKNNFIIEFHETKNTKRKQESNAKKDLRNKFVNVLNTNAKGYRISGVKGMGAKLVLKINSDN
ncbi:hypothetical protein Q0N12_17070 [Rossellomorea marisflavi]|uniref:hypothetical protein n=1 Tax=Rossellomorea marisflavi TaxID=189381 RepID=UPI00345B1E76